MTDRDYLRQFFCAKHLAEYVPDAIVGEMAATHRKLVAEGEMTLPVPHCLWGGCREPAEGGG